MECEDVVSEASPVKIADDGRIENFFEAKHPRILRHSEGQVVFITVSANYKSGMSTLVVRSKKEKTGKVKQIFQLQ